MSITSNGDYDGEPRVTPDMVAANPELYPVTASDPRPIPLPVEVQVSPRTVAPPPERKRMSMIAGIKPEVALYATSAKHAAAKQARKKAPAAKAGQAFEVQVGSVIAGGPVLDSAVTADSAAAAADDPVAGLRWMLENVHRITADERIVLCHKPVRTGVFEQVGTFSAVDALDQLPALAAAGDVWITVNASSGGRRKDNITRWTNLFSDLDVKENGFDTREDAAVVIADLAEIVGPPAAVVNSGGGLQPYWPIADGHIGGPEERDRVNALLGGWGRLVAKVALARGAKIDTNVYEITRILRVPGSWNCKAEYGKPLPVQLLPASFDGRPTLLTLDDLEAVLEANGCLADPRARTGDGTPTATVKPAEWPQTNCAYAEAVLLAWEDDLPENGRHGWHLHRATRLAAMAAAGCITEDTQAAAIAMIDGRLAGFRADDGSADVGEADRNHDKAVERAEGRTSAELLADELGGHVHGAQLQAVTPEYLEAMADRYEADAAAGITTVSAPGPNATNLHKEVGADGLRERAAWLRAAAERMRPGPDTPAAEESSGTNGFATGTVGTVGGVATSRALDPGPFPVDALHPVLRAHAEWLMEAANIPASMAGPMYLPVAAAACGRAVILPRTGWVEQGPLWVIIVAPPSTRKSPILAFVTAPLAAAQESLIKRVDLERAAALAEVKIVEDLLSDAEKAYAEARKAELSGEGHIIEVINAAVGGREIPEVGAVGGATRELREKCNGLQEKLRVAREAVPVRALLSFDDATDAAMQDLMLETGGYALQISPEASDWFIKMVAGDGFFNPGGYLRGYAGEPTVVHRVSRGEVIIENPYLCLLHIIQPEPLGIALKPDANGRSPLFGNGIWARYGAAYVEAVEADVFDRPISGGEDVRAAYAALIEREFLRSYGRVEPLEFVLSDEASALFGSIYNRVERIKESQQQLRDKSMAEEWGKVSGRVLRVARFDAQFGLSDEEVADPDRVHEINVDEIARAWRITEWFVASAAHAMGAAAAMTVEELVSEAISWVRKTLRAKGPTPYRTLRGSKRHRDWLDRALDWMEGDGEISMTPGPRSNAIVSPLNLAAAAS